MTNQDKHTRDHRLMHRGCVLALVLMVISAVAVVGFIILLVK